ncbi:MAG: hypothetical protein ABSC94_00360 [Polyangiaceae bacterium]|jgi:hypothetical protein
MHSLTLTDVLRCRHRSLQTRIAALEFDGRSRRVRVVQLAEELVAHATVEQLVVYPYAEELLGVRDLSVEIESALDALLAVVGGIDKEAEFKCAVGRLSTAFQRHVEGDEIGLLPRVESMAPADHLTRMGRAIEEFERTLANSRMDDVSRGWQGASDDVLLNSAARGGGRN